MIIDSQTVFCTIFHALRALDVLLKLQWTLVSGGTCLVDECRVILSYTND